MNTNLHGLYDLPIPEHARGFFDPEKTRQWMMAGAVDAFHKALNKIETPDFKLHVKDVHIPDPDKRFTYKEQKQAILDKGDLSVPIKATVQLINKKTGGVVEEKKTTLAHLPWLTERNTSVINGSEYIITGQQRLKPGVYTRIKDSGEVEAHVNVQAGTGVGGKLLFHAERALFVYQVGTTQIKVYGLLKDLGVPDSEMEKAWGPVIFQKNKSQYDGGEIDKLYGKIFSHEKNLTPERSAV
jgi:DNA-directed RNA polymerase beta subunit